MELGHGNSGFGNCLGSNFGSFEAEIVGQETWIAHERLVGRRQRK